MTQPIVKSLLGALILCTSYSLSAQTTLIPDPVFEQALIDLGYDNGTPNGSVTTANISSVTSLDISLFALQNVIGDLTGIEGFAALTHLDCNTQYLLSEIDISQNSALTYLNCTDLQLTELDLSGNPLLTTLLCEGGVSGNAITNLDLSQNTDLIEINCRGNQLVELNVSTLGSLQYLNCSANILNSLTLPENSLLYDLNCNGNQLTELTFGSNPYLNFIECGGNQLEALDFSLCPSLVELGCNYNQLSSLDVSENYNLSVLHCTNNMLTSFDVTQDTLLTVLHCGVNQIQMLDISQNNALIGLNCSHNQITSLNVSEDTLLTNMHVAYNQITELDVSNNPELLLLAANNNQLNCLNVQNGNNGSLATNLWFIGVSMNPDLICIQVDNVFWSTSNWTVDLGHIDQGMIFSENCPNDCSITTDVDNLQAAPKRLVRVIDLMGRPAKQGSNEILIHVYSDGTVEKVFQMEE